MTFFGRHIALLVFVFLLVGVGQGQLVAQKKNRYALKKTRIKTDLDYAQRLLDESNYRKKTSTMHLSLLKQKIDYRKNLIETINEEIVFISNKIAEKKQELKTLEKELQAIKNEYEKMVYYAFKHRNSYHKLMFVLAAESFNQAYKRLNYLQQYTDYRKKQVNYIFRKKAEIQLLIEQLEFEKKVKSELLESRRAETHKLQEERTSQSRLISDLETRQQSVKNKVQEATLENQILHNTVSGLILEEVQRAADLAGEIPLYPETEGGSENYSNFEQSKGKLHWPLHRGIITGKFGIQPHPVLKYVQIKNNGIDISTHRTAKARAVFPGLVVSVVAVPGSQTSVLLKHGEYYTLYSRLIDVKIEKGDIVEARENIGGIFTDPETGQTVLQFQIWHKNKQLDPEKWIVQY